MLISVLALACTEAPPPEIVEPPLEQPEPPAPEPEPEPDPEPEPEPECGEEGAIVGVDQRMCAPDFSLPDRDGNIITLSDYRGEVILVDIIGLWCGACRDMAREQEELYQKYEDDGLHVFHMVAEGNRVGLDATLDDAASWQDTLELTYPVVADIEGDTKWEWSRNPDIIVIPMTYIINQEGKIEWFAGGSGTIERMEEIVTDLLDIEPESNGSK